MATRERAAGRRELARHIFRGALAAILAIGILHSFRSGGWATIGLGAFAMGTGLALAVAATLALRRQGASESAVIPTRVLVTDGPYTHCRHPIYTGYALTLIGFGLAMSSWLGLLVGFTAIAALHVIANREEAYLRQQFGDDHIAYANRTRRCL